MMSIHVHPRKELPMYAHKYSTIVLEYMNTYLVQVQFYNVLYEQSHTGIRFASRNSWTRFGGYIDNRQMAILYGTCRSLYSVPLLQSNSPLRKFSDIRVPPTNCRRIFLNSHRLTKQFRNQRLSSVFSSFCHWCHLIPTSLGTPLHIYRT